VHTISLLNRKGGVAKTSSTLNLADAYHQRGYRVLCVDLDPQSTLTALAGYTPEQLEQRETVLALVLPERIDADWEAMAAPAPWGGHIWRASPDLSAAEAELGDAGKPGPHRRLHRQLRAVQDRYDIALVDSPPSVGHLVLNALGAADRVLVPVKADYTSARGLPLLLATVANVRDYEDRPDLDVLGVFITMARRTRHSQETRDGLAWLLGDRLMEASIPLAVAVEDAAAQHQAVRAYDSDDKAATAYGQLADEVAARLGLAQPLREVA
jgi:chromosome partitioning protein